MLYLQEQNEHQIYLKVESVLDWSHVKREGWILNVGVVCARFMSAAIVSSKKEFWKFYDVIICVNYVTFTRPRRPARPTHHPQLAFWRERLILRVNQKPDQSYVKKAIKITW